MGSGDSSAREDRWTLPANRVVVATMSSGARRCGNDVVGAGPAVSWSEPPSPVSPCDHTFNVASMTSRRTGGVVAQLARPPLMGPGSHSPQPRALTGVRLPPTVAAGAEVTADATCAGAPMIVDRYLVHNEVAVHSNRDAGPDARIAAFAGWRPVLGPDWLTTCPRRGRRMIMGSRNGRIRPQRLHDHDWHPKRPDLKVKA
jgi:hypothetical protein